MNLSTTDITQAFLIGATVAGVLLIIGHWFPLPDNNSTTLPTTLKNLLARYIYGTLALFFGTAAALWYLDLAWVAGGILAVNAAGGLVVGAAYGWDHVVKALSQARMIETNDDEL